MPRRRRGIGQPFRSKWVRAKFRIRDVKSLAGIILILIGLLALVTPFTPGSWLIFIGLGLLGFRLAFWEKLRLRLGRVKLNNMEQEVGKVVHYYDKLGVAIIELSAPLAVGDTIKVKKGEGEFQQAVGSMQVEHQAVQSADKGASVGIKADQKVKEGAVVYKIV